MKKIYVVAEIGNMHEGSVECAKQCIETAAVCGVDAVKFQTHLFNNESLPDAPNPPYFNGESRKEYLTRTAFSLDDYKELIAYAQNKQKIDFISSPFCNEAVNFLEEAGLMIYKIASGEVTNLPLLKRIAVTGKKVILSSGMSTWKELDLAFETLRKNGCGDIAVMQCSSVYPCPADKVGLNVLADMKKRYLGTVIGFSDHTLGFAASLAAVAYGAEIIERHFVLSRTMYGSDAKNSLEPNELATCVREIRFLEEALGHPLDKDHVAKELAEMKKVFEKSIVAACDIPKGALITEDMLAFKKPGDGISAADYQLVLGKKTKRFIMHNTKIRKADLEE